MTALLVWLLSLGTLAAILLRPRGWSEAVWASAGAALLVALGLLPVRAAWVAVRSGTDVYLFLAGMMLVAELARIEGVFDWVAARIVNAAHGSSARLLAWVYGAGVVVTALLSNDATAVLLTPAVYAAVRQAQRREALVAAGGGDAGQAAIGGDGGEDAIGGDGREAADGGKGGAAARGGKAAEEAAPPPLDPRPHLFACALVANAASFLLPISNPANLVVFGRHLPPLTAWLRMELAASLTAIAATYWLLRRVFRRELRGGWSHDAASEAPAPLACGARRALGAVLGWASIVLAASALARPLGLPALVAGLTAVIVVTRGRGLARLLRGVTWSVLPLVAGLFVLVAALNAHGALALVEAALRECARLPGWAGGLAAAFSVTALANAMNNLPAGLLVGAAVQAGSVADHLRRAVLIAIDLGPNLSVTGSLATLLWLIALRRDGVEISAREFFSKGVRMLPAVLALTVLAGWLLG